jgi:hypothetical protein
VRVEGNYDYNGDSAEQSVVQARKKIKDAGIQCEIVYQANFTPDLPEAEPF